MAIFVPVSFGATEDPELMKVEGKPLTIEVGSDFTFEPSYVETTSLENSGDNESQMDQCGHTETHTTGDLGWTLSAEGIVTDEELDELKYIMRLTNALEVTTDIHTGTMVRQDVTIDHTDDLNYLHVPQRSGIERVGNAYRFQLQLKDTESDKISLTEEQTGLNDSAAQITPHGIQSG